MTDRKKQSQDPAKRRANLEQVGELLALLLENPETPAHIHDEIVDAVNELTLDSQREPAHDTRRDWPQIVDHLMGKATTTPAEQVAEAAPDKPAEPLSEGIASLTALFEKHKTEGWTRTRLHGYKTGEYLKAILNARDFVSDPQAFEREMVAISIAQLLESKETPAPLYHAIYDCVRGLLVKATANEDLDTESIRDTFSITLNTLAEIDEQEQADTPEVTDEQASEITEGIVSLLALPIPDQLRDFIHHGLDALGSGPEVADSSANPDLLRVWLPAVLKGNN